MTKLPDGIRICGPTPMVPIADWSNMSKRDQKAVLNFQAYLRGKGSRCPICLHKANKHWQYASEPDGSICKAKSCDCSLDTAKVIKLRREVKARGWEDD